MTPEDISSAIVRGILLPPSEWTAEDRMILGEGEDWQRAARARAMLARLMTVLMEREFGHHLIQKPATDDEVLAFTTGI